MKSITNTSCSRDSIVSSSSRSIPLKFSRLFFYPWRYLLELIYLFFKKVELNTVVQDNNWRDGELHFFVLQIYFFFFFFTSCSWYLLFMMSRLNILTIIDMIPWWMRRKSSFLRMMHGDSLRFAVNSWGLVSFEEALNPKESFQKVQYLALFIQI